MSHSSNSQHPHGFKRTSAGTFKSHDQLVEEWLEYEFSDLDSEDDDPDFQPETQNLESDEVSDDESQNQGPSEEMRQQTFEDVRQKTTGVSSEHFKGKNGFIWYRQECPRTSRSAAHNTVRLPGRLNSSNFEGYFDLCSKFFDLSMLESLV